VCGLCVFDCYLLGGSAQGYIEYSCDNVTNSNAYCCGWERCIPPTSAAYGGRICPTAPIANTTSGGFAKYSVSSDDTAKTEFPRQTSPSFLQTGDWGDCSAVPASTSVGCTGNCVGNVRVEISPARAN